MQCVSLLVVLVALCATPALSQTGWIDCIPGDLNIIIGAPHGGDEEPDHIPDRTDGCYVDGECIWTHEDCGERDPVNCRGVVGKDWWTQEMARSMREDLYELFGAYPTLAINLLHRVKFDANRDLDEATFGVPEVVDAWYEFHDCIETAKAEIEANEAWNGMGLYIDNHGHGHPEDWAELGYLLSGDALDNDDYDQDRTAIRNLGDYVADEHGTDFDDLLRGDVSFGYYFEEEGYEAVPSPTNPGPDGSDYFTGGYNTQVHGSRDGGTVDAIQIESARVNRDEYWIYSPYVCNAIHNYMLDHYPGTPDAGKK